MNPLSFSRRPRGVLALGAHPDDVEIGCGGTVLALLAGTPGLTVDWVVFSGTAERAAEARAAAAASVRTGPCIWPRSSG